MIHEEHLPYSEVALRYGVDASAVPHWLKRHGLALSQGPLLTRRRGAVAELPTVLTIRSLHDQGLSQCAIARMYGVSTEPICRLFREHGLTARPAGWDGGKRHVCSDGHRVRSTYELRVDDWLAAHGVQHEYEPQLPFDRRCHADFLANGWYIEVWGVTNRASYEASKERKLSLYRQHGLPLIELHPWTFSKQKRDLFERRLAKTLTPAAGAQLSKTA